MAVFEGVDGKFFERKKYPFINRHQLQKFLPSHVAFHDTVIYFGREYPDNRFGVVKSAVKPLTVHGKGSAP
jgi:hypothetical protein